MKKQLVLVIPLLAAMIGIIAIVGLNCKRTEQSTPETNMTSGNATSGNATIGNRPVEILPS